MKKEQLIEQLKLEPHIEGGYFRRTYGSQIKINVAEGTNSRKIASSIYYMLTDLSPIGRLHKNTSDILHFYHGGAPICYYVIHPDGKLQQTILGTDIENGQKLQLLVEGGCWKASELQDGEFGLISEVVVPGFEYQDMEMANAKQIKAMYPDLWGTLSKFIAL